MKIQITPSRILIQRTNGKNRYYAATSCNMVRILRIVQAYGAKATFYNAQLILLGMDERRDRIS